jgi:hypothetical protein
MFELEIPPMPRVSKQTSIKKNPTVFKYVWRMRKPHHFQKYLSITTGWWCNNHLEKYEFVNGKDDIPYMKWNIKNE